MSKAKIGVVDVGGGYRGIYAAGVLDYCMDNGIRFDTGIGVSAGIRKKYPLAAQRLEQRAQLYNEGVATARGLRAQGKVLIIAPDDTCGVSTLSRDADALRQLYEKGYRDAEKIAAFIGDS